MSDFHRQYLHKLQMAVDKSPTQKLVEKMLVRRLVGAGSVRKDVSEAKAKVTNDANLSDVGKRAAMRALFELAAKANAQDRVALRNARKALKPPTLAPYAPETATLSFLEHQEQRTFLRSLPAEQREKLAPQFAEAIVRAPAAMSGVMDSTKDLLTTKLLQASNPHALASAREDIEALDITEELLRLSDEEIRGAGEFSNKNEFNNWNRVAVAKTLEDAGMSYDEAYGRASTDIELGKLLAANAS